MFIRQRKQLILSSIGIFYTGLAFAATPTVNLKWTPSSIPSGGSSTLSWTSTGADKCYLNGDTNRVWRGDYSWVATNRTKSTTSKIYCTGPGGSSNASTAILTVIPKPTVNLKWTPSSIPSGGSSTLSWTSTGADKCYLNGDTNRVWGGDYSWVATNRTKSTTSKIYCTGPGGSSNASTATLTVIPKPTVNLKWTPSSIPSGGSSTLSWTSTGADKCYLNGDTNRVWGGTYSWVATNRTKSTTSKIYCTGPGGSSNASTATLTIIPKPTVSLKWIPSAITLGEGVTPILDWNADNATSCHLDDEVQGTSGSLAKEDISIVSTSSIYCDGPAGVSETVTATLMVLPSKANLTSVVLRSAFDAIDLTINNGEGYSNNPNANLYGELTWSESYIMMSYLAMYRSTKDVYYLKKLITHSDNVIALRDDNQGRTDYRGISGPTWITTKYSTDKLTPYAWVVNSGMLSYPMADFSQLVLAEPSLHSHLTETGETFLQAANRLKDEVTSTVAAHDEQWDDTFGVYRSRNDAPINYPGAILPHNMNAAMGRTLLMMYKITGRSDYLNKVKKLAAYFDSSLILDTAHDSYIWDYWNNQNFPLEEDLSHGSLDVNFAFLCFKNNIQFNKLDMKRFASTLKHNLYIGPGMFQQYLYIHDERGRKQTINTYLKQTGLWLNLSTFDRDIHQIVSDVFKDDIFEVGTKPVVGGTTTTLIAIANLALYK